MVPFTNILVYHFIQNIHGSKICSSHYGCGHRERNKILAHEIDVRNISRWDYCRKYSDMPEIDSISKHKLYLYFATFESIKICFSLCRFTISMKASGEIRSITKVFEIVFQIITVQFGAAKNHALVHFVFANSSRTVFT